MKKLLTTALAVCVIGTGANADSVMPAKVMFDDGAVAASITGQAGDAAAGRKVFANRKQGNCLACHANADQSEQSFHGEVGPALDGAADRWSEAELRGIVSNAKIMFEDSLMPSFYKTEGFIRPGNAYTGKAADDTFGPLLSAQQIEDVVAYLVTLKEE